MATPKLEPALWQIMQLGTTGDYCVKINVKQDYTVGINLLFANEQEELTWTLKNM